MNYAKLSPSLLAALRDFQEEGRPALARHVRTLGLVSTEVASKPPRIVVFVHCDSHADRRDLAGPGVEINQDGGAVRTGIVDLDALGGLSDNPVVTRIVPAHRTRLLMDVARERVGIPAFRARTGVSGKGVIVGIVDSGIDTDHPAFAGRVLRVWDQVLPGRGVAEGRYGVELRPPMIDISRDTVGHGTHVAGIAAGDDPVYAGVAPGADLVVVKSGLLTAHIADGVRYLFRVAEEMGRPAVVNLSLGSHSDAHDGTDSLSLVIDGLTGPGRIVCCAAGNEGNDNIHAQATVGQGGVRTFAAAVSRPPAGQRPGVAMFNGWYDGSARMSVSVVAPSNEATPAQPVIEGNERPVRTYQLGDGAVRVTTPGPDPANGDVNFLVEVQPAPAPATGPGALPSPPGTWRIRLQGTRVSGDGRVDVWSVDEGTGQFTGATVADNVKIGSPGACTSAVTVGSFTTKVAWEDFFGVTHVSGLDLDSISDFSSEGPRRDGAEKPDLAAPGAMIGAALSGDAGVAATVVLDPRNSVNSGTSMASPFVAGLVALLLECDPALDPEGVKAVLRANSAIPGRAAGTFDRKWGYGLVTAEGL